jgi:hypothetical protein
VELLDAQVEELLEQALAAPAPAVVRICKPWEDRVYAPS